MAPWHVSSYFWPFLNPVGPFFRAKSILPYFSSPNQHHQCNSADQGSSRNVSNSRHKKNSTQQLSFGGVAPRLKTSWFQLDRSQSFSISYLSQAGTTSFNCIVGCGVMDIAPRRCKWNGLNGIGMYHRVG